MPSRARVVMLADELSRKRIELWGGNSRCAIMLAEELANIEKRNDQKIECREAAFFDGESPIAVSGVTALHLYAYLRQLSRGGTVAWIRVDADEVIAFVIWRSLVREDVASHQMPHHEDLGSLRNNG